MGKGLAVIANALEFLYLGDDLAFALKLEYEELLIGIEVVEHVVLSVVY